MHQLGVCVLQVSDRFTFAISILYCAWTARYTDTRTSLVSVCFRSQTDSHLHTAFCTVLGVPDLLTNGQAQCITQQRSCPCTRQAVWRLSRWLFCGRCVLGSLTMLHDIDTLVYQTHMLCKAVPQICDSLHHEHRQTLSLRPFSYNVNRPTLLHSAMLFYHSDDRCS